MIGRLVVWLPGNIAYIGENIQLPDFSPPASRAEIVLGKYRLRMRVLRSGKINIASASPFVCDTEMVCEIKVDEGPLIEDFNFAIMYDSRWRRFRQT